MDDKAIGERVRWLRENRGILQKEAAAALGLDPSALSRIETGDRALDSKSAQALADYFSVTLDFLFGREERTGQRQLPLLGIIRAGIPILAQENVEGFLETPSSLRADFALRVTGYSMSGAGILDGDIVLCRETQTAKSGQIVVALKDDGGISEATLKYFFSGKEPVLKAANPQYQDIHFTRGYRIAGVVVGSMREDAPSYQVYRNTLAIEGREEWAEVIEKAAAAGIKPQQLSMIIDAFQDFKGK